MKSTFLSPRDQIRGHGCLRNIDQIPDQTDLVEDLITKEEEEEEANWRRAQIIKIMKNYSFSLEESAIFLEKLYDFIALDMKKSLDEHVISTAKSRLYQKISHMPGEWQFILLARADGKTFKKIAGEMASRFSKKTEEWVRLEYHKALMECQRIKAGLPPSSIKQIADRHAGGRGKKKPKKQPIFSLSHPPLNAPRLCRSRPPRHCVRPRMSRTRVCPGQLELLLAA